MGAVIQWVVITLAVIGAFGVVAAVWEDLAPRLRREKDEWDVDEDFESDDVRSAAAQLESENEWWEMSLEGLEAQPAFQMSVSALADPDTDVTEVVSLSRDSDGWVASMALAALAQTQRRPGCVDHVGDAESRSPLGLRRPAPPANSRDPRRQTGDRVGAAGTRVPP
jgi:hypothetical protein